MPRSSDDDAPRWELPEDVPRWEPSEWEDTPSRTPSRSVPRWEPEREVTRAQPRRGAAPRGRVGVRVDAPPASRPAARKVSPAALPFAWWATHPWLVLWGLVCLVPGAVLLLRAVDESGFGGWLSPLTWALLALYLVALALAMVASAGRSVSRLTFGTVAVLAVAGALLWPVTQVTLGRTVCPARAGADLGTATAAAALDGWQRGASAEQGWRNGQVDGGWLERAGAVGLLDYRLVETGCWERVAPIDGTRTWHEFRVTVQGRGEPALSKSVVVHTAVTRDGWKITAIEGPLP